MKIYNLLLIIVILLAGQQLHPAPGAVTTRPTCPKRNNDERKILFIGKDVDFTNLVVEKKLITINMRHSYITKEADIYCLNQDLNKFIASYKLIEKLKIEGNLLRSQGLVSLNQLTNLKELDLSYAYISPAGIKNLKKLGNLISLNLSGEKVNDEIIRELPDLPVLRSLTLKDTQITGDGLRKLTKFAKLSTLDLNGCRRLRIEDLSILFRLGNLKLQDHHKPEGISKSQFKKYVIEYEIRKRITKLPSGRKLNIGELRNRQVLDFSGKKDFRDNSLENFHLLENLRVLNLSGTGIGDEGLRHLQRSGKLEVLNLSGTHITDQGLQYLLKLPLRVLDLTGTDIRVIGERAMENLRGLSGLRILRFHGYLQRANPATGESARRYMEYLDRIQSHMLVKNWLDGYKDPDLKYDIPRLQNLEKLDLSGKTGITSDRLRLLAALKSLRHLNLVGSDVNDTALSGLNGMKLEVLELGSMQFNATDENSLKNLAALTISRHLVFYGARPGGNLVANTVQIRRLMLVKNWLDGYKDPDLKYDIPRLQNLEKLDLSRKTGITSDRLRLLAALKRLRHLNLVGSDVIDTALSGLKGMTLEVLELGRMQFNATDKNSLKNLAALTISRHLVFYGAGPGGNLVAYTAQIRRLMLVKNWLDGYKDPDLKYDIPRLQNLEKLDLSGKTGITSDRLRLLAALKKLRHLNLSGSDVNDTSLQGMVVLTALHSLILNNTQITDTGLSGLIKCSALRYLELRNSLLSMRGIAQLGALIKLTTLKYSRKITP